MLYQTIACKRMREWAHVKTTILWKCVECSIQAVLLFKDSVVVCTFLIRNIVDCQLLALCRFVYLFSCLASVFFPHSSPLSQHIPLDSAHSVVVFLHGAYDDDKPLDTLFLSRNHVRCTRYRHKFL
jgi:hypothetical protein